MMAKCPADPCPKCGSAEWKGPEYRRTFSSIGSVQQRSDECLEWACVNCGFTVALPCLDAVPPPTEGSSLYEAFVAGTREEAARILAARRKANES